MEEDERWKELYSLAAKEQDSNKLLEFVQEINHILEEREAQLRGTPHPKQSAE